MQKPVLANRALGEWGILAANVPIIVSVPFAEKTNTTPTAAAPISLHKAGYHPGKIKDFFVKLKEKESYNHQLEKIIRTHPYSEQREKCLERYTISDELRL